MRETAFSWFPAVERTTFSISVDTGLQQREHFRIKLFFILHSTPSIIGNWHSVDLASQNAATGMTMAHWELNGRDSDD